MMRLISRHSIVCFVLCFFIACNAKQEGNTINNNPTTSEKEVISEESPQITIEYVMGLFSPETDDRFVLINEKYADRTGLLMRKEAYQNFVAMYEAAEKENIQLQIRSATRNFDYQKGIWERKWSGKTSLSDGTKASDIANPVDRAGKILLYSSMPGTSRHHWGTDVDLNSFDNSWFDSGQGEKLYQWMLKNAGIYGFCQAYTAKGEARPNGYEEEKWHWSFFPISSELTEYAKVNLKNDMIRGFQGAEVAPEVDMLNNYILGINPRCYQ